MANITFCGAAGTVTGSCSFVEMNGANFLVDCGLFQGNRATRDLNQKPFSFNPPDADFLILTHAHIDHSGLLPKLVNAGFEGPIYATRPTADLLEFMLLDSASIQESNAERINRKQERLGKPAVKPIYTIQDAERTLKYVQDIDYEQWFEPKPGVEVRFWNAGHILGSASAEVKFADGNSGNTLRLLFSGDLGPDEKVFHPEPDAPEGFDYIICESTYGARDRDDYTLAKRRAALREELVSGLNLGGNIVIPSFAVERSQELLHDIGVLLAQGELPDATVYVDSPLARKVTEVFIKYASAMEDVEIDEAELFRGERLRLVQSVNESKQVNEIQKGAIIISASGMCNAGRIKHHLKSNIWRTNSTILFVGYQSPGTLGHIITSGAKAVRIHGKQYNVRANIRRIGNYSAHADQGELIDWILARTPMVGGLFLNHGEDYARAGLRDKLADEGIDRDLIILPKFDERFELVAGTARSKGRVADRIEDEALRGDWFDEYAAFTLALDTRLDEMDDDHQRLELMARLKAALNGGGNRAK